MGSQPKKNLVNSDGTLNIKKVGLKKSFLDDFYHTLMKMSWVQYFAFFILGYLSVNCFFATIYYLGGDNIINAKANSFWEAWLFSFQTSTTLGYGYMLPKTAFANVVVIFDALSGILFVALSTGMAFSKFSRPTSRVIFSDKMILCQFNGKNTLMFRIGNARSSHIVDAELRVVALLPETTLEGVKMKRLYELPLVTSKTPIFGISLVAMHIIDQESPLYKFGKEQIHEKELSFVVSFTGIEDVFSQSVHARKIYSYEHVVEAKKFEDILVENAAGDMVLDYQKFHKVID